MKRTSAGFSRNSVLELLPLEVQDEWNITGNLLDGEDESQEVCLSAISFLIRQKAKDSFGGTSQTGFGR